MAKPNLIGNFESELSKKLKESENFLNKMKEHLDEKTSMNNGVGDERTARINELKELFIDNTFWTTKKIDEYNKIVDNGEIVFLKNVESPYVAGCGSIKKPGLNFGYTPEELEHLKKCKNDPIYFAENFCYVMTEKGYKKIILREYQKRILRDLHENRFNVFCASRQIGKTTISCIFLLWFALFNKEKNILILSNKFATTQEIIDKIKEIFLKLPFFLQCGVTKWAIQSVYFENKCRLFGQATTKTPGIGFTIHLLYIDEFAWIPPNIIEPFFENVFPVLSASIETSRLIITSTPNGTNLFYKIYNGAEKGKNSFHPIRVDWWEVPGRDLAWKEKEISNTSEEAFERQYGNQFTDSGLPLFSSEEIVSFRKTLKKFRNVYIDNMDEENLKYFYFCDEAIEDDYLNKDYFKDGFFIISIDFADGIGQDYTVAHLFKMDLQDENYIRYRIKEKCDKIEKIEDCLEFKQVAYFYSNTITPFKFAEILYNFLNDNLSFDNINILLEANDNRFLILYNLFVFNKNVDENVFFHTKSGRSTPQIGIKLNKINRNSNFSFFKRKMIDKNAIIQDFKTLEELEAFELEKNGTWQSTRAHDDLALSCVNMACIFQDFGKINYLIEEFLSLDYEKESNIYKIIES
ncbi:MAG: terminase family protein [Thomasclavelia ramosa]|nr:terminase family protein [Thomasclavelia ramosa]